MTKQFSTLIFSALTVSIITGCGGGTDPSVPKSVINKITNNYTITRGAYLDLDGLGSTDDVKIINYTWMIDNEIVSDKATDKLLVRVPAGKHKVCLTTEDADKKSNMVCKEINVVEQKIKTPTAIINNIPSSGWKTRCKINIDGKESTANFERTIKTYKWYKDGAEIGSDINQTFVFDTEGEHNITLEVTDNMGDKDTITKSVQIAKLGKPTAKLTLVNEYNQPIFSAQSNVDKTWERNQPVKDTNTPQKTNFVFLSAEGSYDDCNITDDNLTFIWDAAIYNDSGRNTAPDGSCFKNWSEKRDQPMIFNGTKFVAIDTLNDSRIHRNPDGTYKLTGVDMTQLYKYPHVDVVSQAIGGWEGWEGWRNEKWEKAFLAMCTATNPYTHLKVTLTVIDNLHNIKTTVTKVVETRPVN